MPTSGNYIARITGSPIVPRALTAAVRGPRELAVDAIALGGQFDLEFYRQLVRDAYDNAGVRRPLYRLARVPSIYVRTVDTSGRPIGNDTIDPVVDTLTQSIVDWSGGTFLQPIVERGTDSRERVSGWQTVKWDSDANGQHCGMADIAREGGVITFWPRTPGCRCAGQPSIAPPVVRHEVGHMMGVLSFKQPVGFDVPLRRRLSPRDHRARALSRRDRVPAPDRQCRSGHGPVGCREPRAVARDPLSRPGVADGETCRLVATTDGWIRRRTPR
jgi:hypothetical protein